MLDEKDLQALQAMMQTVVERTETKLIKEMDKRFKVSENLILGELDRTRNILEDKIEAVRRNMDELSQYYRITKLESDNTSLLLQMITRLDKEIEELKQRIA